MDRPLAPQGWRSRRHRLAIGMLPVALIGMVVSLTGCAHSPTIRAVLEPYEESKCRHVIETKARLKAHSAWADKYAHCYRNRNHAQDIKQGFIDGFVDTAMGGDGCPPLIAPSSYSGLRMLTHRQPVAALWFEGYPLGVVAAESSGAHLWQQSRLNPQLLACFGHRGCNPGCQPCKPSACGCGQHGCGGGCGAPEIHYGTHAVESHWLPPHDAVIVDEVLVPMPLSDGPPAPAGGRLPLPRQTSPPAPSEPVIAPEPTSNDVSRFVAPAEIQGADVTRAVITGPVEMPNMQVRFDLDDAEWMFGDIEVAGSLLPSHAPYDRVENTSPLP